MKSTELEQFLKDFAATANNVVLKGSYTGENIVVASEFLKKCHEIHSMINKKQDLEKNEG